MAKTELLGTQIKDESVKFVDISGEGNYLYFVGNATTNGSWRVKASSSGNFIIEYRSGGNWITKMTLTP